MKLTCSALAIAFAAASAVSAHFQVLYPPVRGPFNDNNEPQFCDGYTQPANRSPFPLNEGIILWQTTHPSWTVGVLISTVASPTSFGDFHTSSGADQLAVGYYQGNGLFGLCVSVKPSLAGIPGIQNGTNVTLQMVYDGGDGTLYQCMDVTLTDQFSIPADITCVDIEGQPPSSSTSNSLNPTRSTSSTSPASTPNNPSNTGTTSNKSSNGAASMTINGLFGLTLACILAVVLV